MRTEYRSPFVFFLALVILTPAILLSDSVSGKGELLSEPRTALGFGLSLSGFQPAAEGGIATIRISVQARTEIGPIKVSGRLNQGMTFLDGSAEKSWLLSVPAGTSGEFTEEIQISANGLHIVILEAESTLPSGRSIHRSRGLKIWAGIEPPRPRRRGQVLEYPAVQNEDPLP